MILQHSELLQHLARVALRSSNSAMKATCTYRRCEFGRLSGLPALLTNWRQRCAQGGNVVGGEAAVQLAAPIVGGAHLGADCVAESERFFARGAEPPVACRIGHSELEIHWRAAVSAGVQCNSVACVGCGR
jgi:hypothetical protein